MPFFRRHSRALFIFISLIVAIAAPSAFGADAVAEGILSKALANFSSDAPRGWAYTMTTSRDQQVTVERFDPSGPREGQWKLISRDGRQPTAEEQEQYRRYKATLSQPGVRATFSRGDIDDSSAQLVRETSGQLEYLCRFRPDLEDAMLSRLALTLVVDKRTESVASFHFRLIQPFSPALGVKMQQLDVRMAFTPPDGAVPALPRTASSHFTGRVLFFKSIEENLEISYSDFTPPPKSD